MSRITAHPPRKLQMSADMRNVSFVGLSALLGYFLTSSMSEKLCDLVLRTYGHEAGASHLSLGWLGALIGISAAATALAAPFAAAESSDLRWKWPTSAIAGLASVVMTAVIVVMAIGSASHGVALSASVAADHAARWAVVGWAFAQLAAVGGLWVLRSHHERGMGQSRWAREGYAALEKR